MFNSFRLRYPMLNILATSVLLALFAVPIGYLSTSDRPLPVPAVMAFLLALGCNSFLVLEALHVERSLPDCPPFWKFRYGTMMGSFLFAYFGLLYGIDLPSVEALISVMIAVPFGSLVAWTNTRPEPVPDLFDTESPITRSRIGQFLWGVSGTVQLLVALFLSRIDIGSTAFGFYILVLASGLTLPFFLRSHSRLPERELIPVLAIGAALTGLFLALPAR